MNTTVRETDGAKTEQFVAPAASVIEDADGYLLQVEMPGVNKEGLEISTEGSELTVTGRRSLPAIDRTFLHHEAPESGTRETQKDCRLVRSTSFHEAAGRKLRGLFRF
ncbi:MAG: hypothetical protein DMF29_05370 [Verrucomicrobia bacterium]|nr:MAG: hypothetical protein DMF29_05370 [Verrucomicrobiota bacterium]